MEKTCKNIHFLFAVNKRLDEWVTEESLDTRKVHFPRRDVASSTGVSTPKKVHIGAGGGGSVGGSSTGGGGSGVVSGGGGGVSSSGAGGTQSVSR